MTSLLVQLQTPFRWVRDREPNWLRYARWSAAILFLIIGVGWLLGSQTFEGWAHCETTTRAHGASTKHCQPQEFMDMAWAWIIVLVCMWPELGSIKFGPIEVKRREEKPIGVAATAEPKPPPGPQELFMVAWSKLEPWSRLASALYSDGFKSQLAAAAPSPGVFDPDKLAAPEPRNMVTGLPRGPQFSATNAQTWADDAADLDGLRVLSDSNKSADDDDFERGVAQAEAILADLAHRGLAA